MNKPILTSIILAIIAVATIVTATEISYSLIKKGSKTQMPSVISIKPTVLKINRCPSSFCISIVLKNIHARDLAVKITPNKNISVKLTPITPVSPNSEQASYNLCANISSPGTYTITVLGVYDSKHYVVLTSTIVRCGCSGS